MLGLLIGLACAVLATLAGMLGTLIGFSVALLCFLVPLSPFFLALLAIIWLVKRPEAAAGRNAGV